MQYPRRGLVFEGTEAHSLECPSCKASIRLSTADLKSGRKVTCGACKEEHTLSGPDMEQVERDIEAHVDRIEKMFR